jgi:2-polyprenyl-6-methoxyphenol hydroxylase-like FAD-dependent oxidoreductase
MEDAVGLARCLSDVPDREADFAPFEQFREGRVEKLVEEARRNRDRKAPTNALTRGLRDLVLPFFLEMGIENARKAYSYTVDRDEKVA